MAVAAWLDADEVNDLAPLARRAVSLDASSLLRLRRSGGQLSALVRLPFGVLAGRTIAVDVPSSARPDDGRTAGLDVTVGAGQLLGWLDGDRPEPPEARDADWRSGIPPATGWQRVDTVPDSVVRPLIRSGALTLQETAAREGVPGAQPRAEVADALLDSTVLTVSDGPVTVALSLRTLSAVTRLGFLPSGSYVAVDVASRWIRVAAAYGSVFAERPGATLGLTLR